MFKVGDFLDWLVFGSCTKINEKRFHFPFCIIYFLGLEAPCCKVYWMSLAEKNLRDALNTALSLFLLGRWWVSTAAWFWFKLRSKVACLHQLEKSGWNSTCWWVFLKLKFSWWRAPQTVARIPSWSSEWEAIYHTLTLSNSHYVIAY